MSYSCQRYWSSLRVFKSFAAWMECFFFSFIWEITVSFNSCLQLQHVTYNSSLPLSVGNMESSHGQEFDRTKLWLCLKGFPRHWPIIFFFKMKSIKICKGYSKNKLESSTVLWSWYKRTLWGLWLLRLWYCFPQLHDFYRESFTG